MHALAHAINAALGNVGKTVRYTAPVGREPVVQAAALRSSSTTWRAGRVRRCAIVGGNPVFTAPADLEFGGPWTRCRCASTSASTTTRPRALCHWHVPEAHYLESWSDVRAFDGTVTILQPLIAPLYAGKTAHEMLAAFSAEPERTRARHRPGRLEAESAGGGDEAVWRKALHDGVVEGSASPAKAVDAARVSPPRRPAPPAADGSLELLFRPDPTIGDGRYANNGWLQELPSPLTKLTWDNAALIAPATAAAARRHDRGRRRADAERPHGARRRSGSCPGRPTGRVTVHLGYGRTRGGRVGNGAGFDAYALRDERRPVGGPGLAAREDRRAHEPGDAPSTTTRWRAGTSCAP